MSLNIRDPFSTRRAVHLYRHFVSPGDLCIDVGANKGERAEALLRLGARVVAFEPQADLISAWKPSVRRACTVIPAGLSDHVGTACIYQGSADTLATMSADFIEKTREAGRFQGHVWSQSRIVDVLTLDVVLAEFGLARFIKIDVEGYEDRVLAGLSKPVNALSFEFTPEMLKVATNCVAHLDALGSYEFTYSSGNSLRFGMGWLSSPDLLKVLINLKPGIDWGDVYARARPS